MSFELSLARLEAIVRELERNDIALEQALTLFEEGIGHLRTAGAALASIEARVQQLVEAADGSFALTDLGAER